MVSADVSIDQWAGLTANVGVWQGEFIRLDPQRQELSRVASCIRLMTKGERHLEQQLDIGGRTQTLQITSLKKGLLFFPSGAFSQGSLQWAPFGEFGVELGLLAGQARRRLVALYRAEEQQSYLTNITLIPESAPDYSHLRQAEPWGDVSTALTRTSPSGAIPEVRKEAIRIDTAWQPETKLPAYALESQPLPYQCACALPLVLPRQQPFSLGLSWQVTPHERQHIARDYDASGAWQAVSWYRERT